jgi:hypothetical protein
VSTKKAIFSVRCVDVYQGVVKTPFIPGNHPSCPVKLKASKCVSGACSGCNGHRKALEAAEPGSGHARVTLDGRHSSRGRCLIGNACWQGSGHLNMYPWGVKEVSFSRLVWHSLDLSRPSQCCSCDEG